MICQMCGFNQKPELIPLLKTHVETCEMISTEMQPKVRILWDKELVATVAEPKKTDHVMDVKIEWHEPAEAPPILPIHGVTTIEELDEVEEVVVVEEPVVEVVEVVKPAPKKRATKK